LWDRCGDGFRPEDRKEVSGATGARAAIWTAAEATEPVGPFKPHIDERLAAGVWNAVVLLRELRAEGYDGCYSTVKEDLQPKREEARGAAVRRFETAPGRQAQVDWGHLGT
jgi:transposase